MNYCLKTICLAFLVVTFSLTAIAQDKPVTPAAPVAATPPVTPPKAAPKPYKEVITNKAITSKGLFTMHKVEDKYYAELPVNLLGRDILVVNRVSKSSVEICPLILMIVPSSYSLNQLSNFFLRNNSRLSPESQT